MEMKRMLKFEKDFPRNDKACIKYRINSLKI